MRTDLETMGSGSSPRDHFPRRSQRRGVTRMVLTTTITLLILAGIGLGTPEATAGSVVYTMDNYPALQDGYQLTGTITATDGSISGWDITIAGVNESFTPANSSFGGTLIISSTQITVTSWVDLYATFVDYYISGISWSPQYSSYSAEISPPPTLLWNTTIPDAPFGIATVPEPSSGVLAVLGGVTGLTYGWFWCRRGRHRQGYKGPTGVPY